MNKVYQALAGLIEQREALTASNTPDKDKHLAKLEQKIEYLVRNFLPHGSGFDNGTALDKEESSTNKLIFSTMYHSMTDNGMYDGWTSYRITITASLARGYVMDIVQLTDCPETQDADFLRDYVMDTITHWLGCEVYWDTSDEIYRHLGL